jgi:hypothetical protein
MPDGALAELALATALTAWWSRWQPMTIHAALRAGATDSIYRVHVRVPKPNWS